LQIATKLLKRLTKHEMKLDKKTALVTGGGSGIGLAISKALVASGVTVIICGRNRSKLEKAKKQYPKLEIEECDITNTDQIKELVKVVGEKYEGIDLLINNAGMFAQVDYTKSGDSFEMQEREIDVDFTSPLRVIHYFLPMLKNRNEAAVINVSSGLAFVPLTLAPVYCASKAALHAWTRSFRFQMANTKIKVFELMPPLVETDMVADFKDQKMMKPENLANDFIKGLLSDTLEITPGQSSQLRMMSRLAPSFIFKAVNKQFV
jgi:uncharacterized oxidoreductase